VDLRVFDLDERGDAFVRDQLSAGNVLSSALLEVVRACRGRTSTVAPADTSTERLYAFTGGGLLPTNFEMSRARRLPDGSALMWIENLNVARAERILALMQGSVGRVCVLDDFDSNWADLRTQEEPEAFGVNGEVYYLIGPDASVGRLAVLLTGADAIWHGVAAVCHPAARVLRDGLAMPESLKACAQSLVELSCTAYDGEGFVIWTPQ
jgi:hypothetical protein